jgi:hypothetical protein
LYAVTVCGDQGCNSVFFPPKAISATALDHAGEERGEAEDDEEEEEEKDKFRFVFLG